MNISIVHLSQVIRRPFRDTNGDRIGRIQDLVARMGESPHPPIVGAVVRIGSRDLFVPMRKIAGLDHGRLTFEGERVDLRKFERRPGEILLGRDLLARHAINLVGGRLITANEIELAEVDGVWEVVGVDPGRRPVLRRLTPRPLANRVNLGAIVDFASLEPFVGHVPSARLRIPYRKLAKLHPAQIADLVEQASHEEGEEIIDVVRQDRELEADVFEELDTEHQVEFIETRSNEEAAGVLGRMGPDAAADLIVEVDQERRRAILELLPASQREKVRTLLTYHPGTAGGMMSPDFVLVHTTSTAEDALESVRRSTAGAETLAVVYVVDSEGGLAGSASVVDLLRAPSAAKLESFMRPVHAHLHPSWDLNQVARKMSDFNLTVAPVLDEAHGGLVGVVTVDDLVARMIPDGWRGAFGVAGASEE